MNTIRKHEEGRSNENTFCFDSIDSDSRGGGGGSGGVEVRMVVLLFERRSRWDIDSEDSWRTLWRWRVEVELQKWRGMEWVWSVREGEAGNMSGVEMEDNIWQQWKNMENLEEESGCGMGKWM